ncbi:MAG: 3-hydroxyacyl-CoA dehydrogenase family protein [Deltaproteobacteria bacterium]|nr:MAG: 3-hydroxyacyl-CoA dehydrogenase family protein [Deltaproteobacteria bacterium]
MEAKDVKRVAIIGAGVMGHSIAQVFATAGIETNLMDLKADLLPQALKLVGANLKTLAEYGRIKQGDISAIVKRIHPTTDLAEAVRGMDFVLEAVLEVPDIKKKLFRQLDGFCSEQTVLASNSSGLDIFNLIEIRNPSRFVAAHWFAPPHIIPLVEVAPGPKTSPEAVQFTAKLMERIGKRPVVLKRFFQRYIVNRLQHAMIPVIIDMIENDWASPEDIDYAVKTTLGIRLPIVGVAQSMDFNGLRVVRDVCRSLGIKSRLIEERVEQGYLGPVSSKGIYDYGGRSEEEVLRKRDMLYLKMIDHLEKMEAFKPV